MKNNINIIMGFLGFMEQIFKEIVEIGFAFPAETEFTLSNNGLKVSVLNGRIHMASVLLV